MSNTTTETMSLSYICSTFSLTLSFRFSSLPTDTCLSPSLCVCAGQVFSPGLVLCLALQLQCVCVSTAWSWLYSCSVCVCNAWSWLYSCSVCGALGDSAPSYCCVCISSEGERGGSMTLTGIHRLSQPYHSEGRHTGGRTRGAALHRP